MRLLIVVSLLLATPRLAVAQFPAEVQPGTRVRVWIPEANRQEQVPNRNEMKPLWTALLGAAICYRR